MFQQPPGMISDNYESLRLIADAVKQKYLSRGLIYQEHGMIIRDPDQNYSNSMHMAKLMTENKGINISYYTEHEIKEKITSYPWLAGQMCCPECIDDIVKCADPDECTCVFGHRECNQPCQCEKNSGLLDKPAYPGLIRFYGEEKGFGVESIVPIKEGTMIGEYCGHIVKNSNDIIERSYEMNIDIPTFDQNSQDLGIMIDGSEYSNFTSFINHACHANCKSYTYFISSIGEYRNFIYADKDIQIGEEYTLNYGSKYISGRFFCACRASDCLNPNPNS